MLYYLVASLGFAWILKYGEILNPIRNILTKNSEFYTKLFKCCMCLGVYTGIFMTPFVVADFGAKGILFPLASSAFCWASDVVIDFICSVNLLAEQKLNLHNHHHLHQNHPEEDHKGS